MKNSPVITRGALYVFLAFLPVFLAGLQPFVEKDVFPSRMMFWYIVGQSTYAALLVLRSFLDGTVERHKQERIKKDEKTTSNS